MNLVDPPLLFVVLLAILGVAAVVALVLDVLSSYARGHAARDPRAASPPANGAAGAIPRRVAPGVDPVTGDELETIAHGPGIVEFSPVTCGCGRPVRQVGSPSCGCATAQAADGHHRSFLCEDIHCPGLRRGPCELDPEDTIRWRPEVHGSH